MKKLLFIPLVMAILIANMAFAADEIHWTFTGQNSVTFDWRGTSTEKTIGYGLTSGVYTQVNATTPNPAPVSSKGPFWEANLAGLKADTRYYYSIGNGPERSFRTPPAPGISNFNVYALGNIGSSSTYFETGAVQDIIANDLPSFVVGLGDLTLGGTDGKAAVDQHFNDIMVWSKEAAYMPVWGDLEWVSSSNDSFKNYKGRFAVPNPQTSPGSPLAGGEDWYWFDYGNTRFITLPEPWSGAWSAWNTTADALMAQAQTDPNIKFIATFGHQPAYSSGHYSGSATLKSMLDKLGDTYSKYTLNINGHSNNYERSLPQHGVTHVTVGTGGTDLTQDGTCLWLTCEKPVWSAFRAMHLGALKLHFTDSGIEGSFICGPAGGGTNDVSCTQGSVVDKFTITSPTFAPSASNSVASLSNNAQSLSNSVTPQVANAATTCAQTALNVSSAYSDSGFAYIISGSFGTPADNSTYPNQSTLRLFENGIEMGPSHSIHADIRNLGLGRFSHWSATNGSGEALRFSASNNTDPRTNGKSYTYCTTNTTITPLPDVIVTSLSYANGIFTSTVKNQGTAATPANLTVGVGYWVDGVGQTWGSVMGPLAAGASVTIGTNGASYAIPTGTHTIMAYADDVNRFAESNETNNQLSKSITVSGTGIQGFAAAAGVTGGAGGQNIVVTNLNASGPGSLKAAIATPGTRNITFTPGLTGTITWTDVVTYVDYPNMTIDGTGANITISGMSLSIFKSNETAVNNIIICNLTFANTTSNRNAINIEFGSYNIWIDHNTFYNNSTGAEGQGLAIWDRDLGKGGLTGITVSWNHFKAPNIKGLLIGNQNDSSYVPMRVSVHHNWFDGINARNPRIHGNGILVHAWNNYVNAWTEYGMGASAGSNLLAENNVFDNTDATYIKAIDGAYGYPVYTKSNSTNATGNFLLGSPLPTIVTVGTFPRAQLTYSVTPEDANDTLKQRIIQGAGSH